MLLAHLPVGRPTDPISPPWGQDWLKYETPPQTRQLSPLQGLVMMGVGGRSRLIASQKVTSLETAEVPACRPEHLRA